MTAAGATGSLALLACAALVALVAPPPASAVAPPAAGADDPRTLLEAAVASLDQPHVGRVSVVTFSEEGPRVADLAVRVGAFGDVELRRPTRWLLGAPGSSWLRTAEGAVTVTPAATGLGLDVDAVLAGWDATVAPATELDTGRATPVRLVRRSGAAIEEVVYLDHATGLPVRRETRGADGRVLRVVAYTTLARVELGAAGAVPAVTTAGMADADVAALVADGYTVPASLGAGFTLLAVGRHDEVATARYGDGLSVLSVYQQHGRLDPSELEGASRRTVAGRDVWTWPGSEPVRLVWTGGDRTWTVVSDAPLEVIEDALGSLPGEHVGHDVPSRVVRGMSRAWTWVRDVVG